MTIEYAYGFSALNSADQQIQGMIYAQTPDAAWVKLKRAGFRPQRIAFNVQGTFTGLLSSEFNQRELSMFYSTIGKRYLTGRPLIEGLESAATFVLDPRLKQSSLLIAQAVSDGSSMSSAMKTAGFPARDAMAIRAAEDSGKIGDAFVAMASDVSRREELSRKLRTMFMMPLALGLAMYVGIYASAFMLVPKIRTFMESLGNVADNAMKDPLLQLMFAFVDWVHAYPTFSMLVWGAIPVGIFSAWKGGWIAKAADHMKSWRDISEKSDMAATWMAFGMLYEAGVTPFEAARTVRPSAKREQTKAMFHQLERSFYAGRSTGDATQRAGFPDYIVRSIRAAESSGFQLPDEIRAMTERLWMDVEIMTTNFQEKMRFYTQVILALMIIAFANATIAPLMRIGFQST